MRCESPTQIWLKPSSSESLARWIIFGNGSVGKSPTPNSKLLTQSPSLTARLACDSLRGRCLLTASGDANFAVDDHHRNARQITLTKGIQRILRYRAGDLVHQHKVCGPPLFQDSDIQIMRAADVARRHTDGFFRRDFADRRYEGNLAQNAARDNAGSARGVRTDEHALKHVLRLDRANEAQSQPVVS